MNRRWGLALAGALWVALTVALSRVSSEAPSGAAVLHASASELDWSPEIRGEGQMEVTSDRLVLRTGTGERVRAEAWGPPLPPGRWWIHARVRAPKRGDRARIAVRTDTRRIATYNLYADDPFEVDLRVQLEPEERGQLGAVLAGPGGQLEVLSLRAIPVERRLLWDLAAGGLAVAGLGLAGGALWRFGPVPVAALGVLVAGLTIPREWVDAVFGRYDRYTLLDVPIAAWAQELFGHFGLFAVLGGSVVRAGGGRGALAALVGLAVASEAAQLLAIHRSPSLLDVALDTVGVLVGAWIARRISPSPGAPPAPPESGASRT